MIGTESLTVTSILVGADGGVGEGTQADSTAIGRHFDDGKRSVIACCSHLTTLSDVGQ